MQHENRARVFRLGAEIEDPWRDVADDSEFPNSAHIVVSLQRFLTDADAFRARRAPVGAYLQPDDDPAELAAHLDALGLIVVVFPTFRDGRGFSTARLLRERYGYRGELRARGEILIDQAAFLLRCGFDSLEFNKAVDLEKLNRAVAAISTIYQPAADGAAPIWARRPPIHGSSGGAEAPDRLRYG
ncbi:MAG: DUF934 domain-containing protein [Parvularculaceae bacterium]